MTLDVAREAGLVGVRRVLDSTPLYDAVATMDTVTLVYSAIRRTLGAAGERELELRALLSRDDDYAGLGKPACDYTDRAAREELISSLAADGYALLAALQDETLPDPLAEMARLLSTLLGQDLDEGDDGTYRIARRVAPDRVISTVDVEARHGHRTAAHSFDGYKGHIALDPDTEIVTATAVGPANAGDAAAVAELLADDLVPAAPDGDPDQEPLTVYGDSAYGTGALIESLEAAGAKLRLKVAAPTAPAGRFPRQPSRSILSVARSAVRQGGPFDSAAPGRASANVALPVRSWPAAQARRTADRSASDYMRPHCREQGRSGASRPGVTTIERSDQRSSARSLT